MTCRLVLLAKEMTILNKMKLNVGDDIDDMIGQTYMNMEMQNMAHVKSSLCVHTEKQMCISALSNPLMYLKGRAGDDMGRRPRDYVRKGCSEIRGMPDLKNRFMMQLRNFILLIDPESEALMHADMHPRKLSFFASNPLVQEVAGNDDDACATDGEEGHKIARIVLARHARLNVRIQKTKN